MTPDLWRVFVPTWRFFDRVGARPRVFVRSGSDWVPALSTPPRRWFSWFFNPAGNLQHADQNLVERLIEEMSDSDAVAELTSYRILARRLGPAFKIVVRGEAVLASSE